MELEIKSLVKKFKDKTAVDNFNVTLKCGIYGLIGPNGSGKTTLMRMIADVISETEGSILLNGKDKKSMEDNDVVVRIVGDKKPKEEAKEQNPDLEDLFLYYFGMEDVTYDRVG